MSSNCSNNSLILFIFSSFSVSSSTTPPFSPIPVLQISGILSNSIPVIIKIISFILPHKTDTINKTVPHKVDVFHIISKYRFIIFNSLSYSFVYYCSILLSTLVVSLGYNFTYLVYLSIKKPTNTVDFQYCISRFFKITIASYIYLSIQLSACWNCIIQHH